MIWLKLLAVNKKSKLVRKMNYYKQLKGLMITNDRCRGKLSSLWLIVLYFLLICCLRYINQSTHPSTNDIYRTKIIQMLCGAEAHTQRRILPICQLKKPWKHLALFTLLAFFFHIRVKIFGVLPWMKANILL